MKTKILFHPLLILGILVLTITACKKNDIKDENNNTKPTATLPVLTTTSVTLVTDTSAQCGGTVTSDGGATVTERGVCWSNYSSFEVGSTLLIGKTTNGSGTGSFTSSIKHLTSNFTYYVRAYATNSAGTAYGNTIKFITGLSLASLNTATIIAITSTTAESGGFIVYDDASLNVTARGVCWSTKIHPTIADSKTIDKMIALDTEHFKSLITGLTENTTYYVRAYATNSAGTAYGNELSFKTPVALIYGTMNDIDGNSYKTITIGNQTWMAENLKTSKLNDGTPIAFVYNNSDWQFNIDPAYCYYNDDAPSYKDIYGALYNWDAIYSGKLAPTGWHIPSDAEWTTLTTYLGGDNLALGKMESTSSLWTTYNANADNSSGFSGLPSGWRQSDGSYYGVGGIAYYWSSTGSVGNAWDRYMSNQYTGIGRQNDPVSLGLSIRCVKD